METSGRSFLVGVPLDDSAGRNAGLVQCRSGSDGRVLLEVPGRAAGDRLGVAVAAVGDLDGDGKADAAAGTLLEPPGGLESGETLALRAGYVLFISSSDGRVLRTVHAPDGALHFGVTLAPLGDLDGDGRPDVAVANTFWDFTAIPPGVHPSRLPGGTELVQFRGPRVRAFSGATGKLLRIWASATQDDAFGAQVIGCGDLDGDEVSDVLITAPSALGSSASVATYSAATGRRLRALPRDGDVSAFHAPDETHRGVCAARLGDLDGDGIAEVAIGGASIRSGGGTKGCLHVYSPATGKDLMRLTRRALDD